MISWWIGHLIAVGIGISLGLMGGGGSILAVPTLVYVMGIPAKQAIAITLAAVGTVSLLGAIPHWKLGNVRLKTASVFGLSTMIGAYSGARLATLPFITGTIQMLLFGTTMLLAAILMIRKSGKGKISPSLEPEIELEHYPKPVCKYCPLWVVTEGIGVGILTGLVGVGGGFAIVPALVLLAKVPMKQAIGTSLVIVFLNSVAGFYGYLGRVELNWHLMISFTVAASLGIFAGAYLVKFIQAKHLQKGFGYFLLFMAAFILWQNRAAFDFTSTHKNVSVKPISRNFSRTEKFRT